MDYHFLTEVIAVTKQLLAHAQRYVNLNLVLFLNMHARFPSSATNKCKMLQFGVITLQAGPS